MLKKSYILLFLLFFFSCTTTRITTTNLHDLASFEEGSDIYALPQTRLLFTTTVVKSTFTPGPYCDYAETCIGIDNVQNQPITRWNILDLNLAKITEPDPDHFYSIKAEGKPIFDDKLIGLKKEGLLLLPVSLNGFQIDYTAQVNPVMNIQHTDLSVKPFYTESKISTKKTGRDSLNSRLPVYQKHLNAKATETKAKEAAAFIIKIRKRRFKLLAGQYEVFPEGTALETAVRELNQLEEEYLALFIGKETNDTIKKVFSYVPDGNERIQRISLFKFSEISGFISPNSSGGEAVVVEITNLNKTATLDQLQLPVSATRYTNLIFYRLPDRASVKTHLGSHLLHEAEIPVCQFGALIPKYLQPKGKSILQK